MSEQLNIQRISAYAWALILVLSGGALFLVALGGSPGGDSATVLASKRDVITSTDQGSASDAVLQSNGNGTGITPVSGTD